MAWYGSYLKNKKGAWLYDLGTNKEDIKKLIIDINLEQRVATLKKKVTHFYLFNTKSL
jgi:hypothetical protein